MTERIERTEDLFLVDLSPNPPTEEGQVRQVDGDIVAFIGGAVKSLTAGGGSLPPATQAGQVLFSADGMLFAVALPVTCDMGWLVNDGGILLVVG